MHVVHFEEKNSHLLYEIDHTQAFFTHQWIGCLMGLNHSKVNSCIQFSPAHSNLCIMCIPKNMMSELLKRTFFPLLVVFFILLIKYLFINSLWQGIYTHGTSWDLFFYIHFTKQMHRVFFFFFFLLHTSMALDALTSIRKQSKAHSADPHGFKPFQSELMHSDLTSTLQPMHYVYTQNMMNELKGHFFLLSVVFFILLTNYLFNSLWQGIYTHGTSCDLSFTSTLQNRSAQAFFFFFFFYTSMELEAFIRHGNNLKPTLPILMGLNHSKMNSCIQFSPAHSNLCIMCIPKNMMNKLKGNFSPLSCILYFTDQVFVY